MGRDTKYGGPDRRYSILNAICVLFREIYFWSVLAPRRVVMGQMYFVVWVFVGVFDVCY